MSDSEHDTLQSTDARKNAIKVLLICVLIAVPVSVYIIFFGVKDEAGVSNHGMIALALAVVLGFLTAFLFMGITFFSARSGHDDQPNYREMVERQRKDENG